MGTVVWQGTAAQEASFINITRDPLTSLVTGIATQGPVRFTPAQAGLPELTGMFSSTWTPPPGTETADVAAAWAQAEPSLFHLDPARVFTVTITVD
jgi:hypothetical protein